ncbi:MAG: SprT-like domain-containing protein [Reichenbachiella sp.]
MKPTSEQFLAFERLFGYFNKNLFDNSLPDVLLNFSRSNTVAGFFAATRWRHSNGEKKHEISINPTSLAKGHKYLVETLVHEMCHLWQMEFGKPSRTGYHNKEWAAKMESVGLIPSSTGGPGGNKTGQRMADYMEEGGSLEVLIQQLPENYWLPFQAMEYVMYAQSPDTVENELSEGEIAALAEAHEQKEKKRKRKYSCPSCGVNIWGKPDLNVTCGDCDVRFEGNI